MFLRGQYQHDRRYPQRLTGSYLVSLLIHVLIAALVFTVASSSSEEGATESVIGGQVVTVETRAPAVAQQPVQVQPAAPQPYAPRTAAPAHPKPAAPLPQPIPPQPKELAQIVPSASPEPSPLPQSTAPPLPQPTQEPSFEPLTVAATPAIPTPQPRATILVANVSLPTVTPKPQPSAVATVPPTPRPPVPTAAPTVKPQTPAPAAATPKPSATPATPAPAATAKPTALPTAAIAQTTASPAPRIGVPSPTPTLGAAISQTHGTAPSPGPKGVTSPGPREGTGGNRPGPQRPVQVRATPSPGPSSTSAKGAGAKKPPTDWAARWRGLLAGTPSTPRPNNFHPSFNLGAEMNPTPPPEVLAQTKYTFIEHGAGDDAEDEMWVTSVRRAGPAMICEGWLVRYPYNPNSPGAPTNGVSISIGGGRGRPGMLPPVIEAHATTSCNEHSLVPYAPSPAPSS